MREGRGFAGRIAHAFIDSKLTPLIIAASILLGVGAVLMLPREEEPMAVLAAKTLHAALQDFLCKQEVKGKEPVQ